jgi:hypothetical protein
VKFNLVGPFVVNAPFGTEIAFAKGLRRIGHEVVEIDPNLDKEMVGLQNTADATVVFKSCVGNERFLKSLKHPVVVYQPDDARFPHIRQMMLMMREYSDLFLSFDDHGASVAKTMGYRAAETLLLTADDELYCPSASESQRDIDVSFIGSLGDPVAHASRRRMIEIAQDEATKRGWKTAFGTTQDIPTILDTYRRSKVVLNHATDVGQPFGTGYGLQCRHFEVAMTKTALLSNKLFGVNPYESLSFVQFEDESSLRSLLVELVERDNPQMYDTDYGRPLWQIWGEYNFNWANENKPEHRAKELVDFIVRNS